MISMKTALALILLLATAFAVSSSYNVVVAENGNTWAAITLAGQGTVNVPLPIDAEPQVSGALYVNTVNGIDVTVGSSGAANIVFQSSTMTEKTNGDWGLALDLPSADTNSVTVSLPGNTAVSGTTPSAEIAPVSGSKNIVWNSAAGSVSVEYSFTAANGAVANGAEDNGAPVPQADYTWLIGLVVVVVLAAAGFFYLKKKGGLTEGQKNVLKTLSDNEKKVMDFVVNNRGIKRNVLERESGLAKSSLATTLAQLEKKKLVAVKREATVHYVDVTDWFKSL
ncbi:MarR family transcriptional regulator [archaeon]